MTAFGIGRHDCLVDGLGEVFGAGEGLASEMMPLQVAPHPFDIIDLRSGVRQPLDLAPMPTGRERSPCRLAGMDRAIVEKAICFWEPPVCESKSQVSWYEPVIRLIWAIQYIALLVGTLGTLAVPGPRDRRVAVLWLALASCTSVFMVFSVEDRYREPIMPVLWVMAAIAVEAAYRQWRPREGSSRAVLGASILGKPAGLSIHTKSQRRNPLADPRKPA